MRHWLYCLFFLFVSCSTVNLAVPTKVSVKTDTSSKQFRFSELEEKQLSLFTGQTLDLSALGKNWQVKNAAIGEVNASGTFIAKQAGITEVRLQTPEKLFKVTLVVLQRQQGQPATPTLRIPESEIITSDSSSTNSSNSITASDKKTVETIDKSPSASNLPETEPDQNVAPRTITTSPVLPSTFISPNLRSSVKVTNILSTPTTLQLFWKDNQITNTLGFNIYMGEQRLPPKGQLSRNNDTFSYTIDDLKPNTRYLVGVGAMNKTLGEMKPQFLFASTSNLKLNKPTTGQNYSPGSLVVFQSEFSHFSAVQVHELVVMNGFSPLKDSQGNSVIQQVNSTDAHQNLSINWDTRELSTGSYNIHLAARDQNGQVLAETKPIQINLRTSTGTSLEILPAITSVTPVNSYNDLEHHIVIEGTSMALISQITLGASTPLSNVVLGDTRITATIPIGTPKGTYVIRLTNPDGSIVESQAVITLIKRLFVNAGAGGGNSGEDWSNASTDLQPLLSASSSGDEIWVAQGTYKPTTGVNRSDSFQLKEGVNVYGGFAGGETLREQRNPTTNPTILDGDIGLLANNTDNSFHVVTGSNNTILDGFTIQNGNANGGGANQNQGGAMFNDGVSPTLNNITFSNNNSGFLGGGMANINSASVKITNSTFDNNSAILGGAISNFTGSNSLTLEQVTFTNNTALSQQGGGIFSDTATLNMTNVTFSTNTGGAMYSSDTTLTADTMTVNNNTSTTNGAITSVSNTVQNISNATINNNNNTGGSGGGFSISGNSTLNLSNSTVSTNTASADGAGMFIQNSTLTINDVTFTSNNSTTGFGGGLLNDNATFSANNLTFTNNTAFQGGGGLKNRNGPTGTYNNVTFTNNSAGILGGGALNFESSPTYTNVIFNGNMATNAGSNGGGMANNTNSLPVLTNVTFINNTADPAGSGFGGGMGNETNGSPTLNNVTFTSNQAASGGGMSNVAASNPNLTQVIFSQNVATIQHGGAMINSVGSSPILNRTVFHSNQAQLSGGAMANIFNVAPVLTNVIFSANRTITGDGGGTYCFEAAAASSISMTNVTFSNNQSAARGGGFSTQGCSNHTLINTIFWGNTAVTSGAQVEHINGAGTTISFSDIEGGIGGAGVNGAVTNGGNNVATATNPFVNPADPDGADNAFMTGDDGLRLLAGSLSIDSGSAAAPAIDIAGAPRPINSVDDMGAYEQ